MNLLRRAKSDQIEGESLIINSERTLRERSRNFLAFHLTRNASTASWFLGVTAGIQAQDRLGISPIITTPVVAAAVTAGEYVGSGKYNDITANSDAPNKIPRWNILKNRVVRQVIAGSYSVWAGAMSTGEVNKTLGVESTNRQRLAQSALYGSAVGFWTSDVPPFVNMREGAIDIYHDAINNPVTYGAWGLAGSIAVYGALRVVDKVMFKEVDIANLASMDSVVPLVDETILDANSLIRQPLPHFESGN